MPSSCKIELTKGNIHQSSKGTIGQTELLQIREHINGRDFSVALRKAGRAKT
jgi:hypothetical protein